MHLSEAGVVVSVGGIPVVSGDDGSVVRSGADLLDDPGGEAGIEIRVQIGELKQAESVEGSRKGRKIPLDLAAAHVEKMTVGDAPHPTDLQSKPDQRIDREKALQPEKPLSLMKQAGGFAGLSEQALG